MALNLPGQKVSSASLRIQKKQYKTCVILRFWLSVIDPSPQPGPDTDDEISREAPGECLGDAASGGARAHHLRGARHGEGGSS